MVNTEGYETTTSSWREEFQKSYVEWVDLELIEALLSSMDCSVRFLCNVINDTTRWPSKLNKSLRTVSYPRIRDAADFLGIPPWLLFQHKEKNSKIKELFNEVNSALKPIDLPFLSDDYPEIYYDFEQELAKWIPKDQFIQVSNTLKGLLGHKHYHEILAGNWRSVFSFFNAVHRDFSGGAKFFHREPNAVFRGNLRLNFCTHPKNKRIQIRSGWLSLESEPSEASRSHTMNMLISKIISDMEWIFDQQPLTFQSELDGKRIYLLTWHSLRTSSAQFETLQSLINRMLPEANFSMNITEKHKSLSSLSSSLIATNPFEEFIQIIQKDVVTHHEPKNKRRRNSLQILFEQGIIQSGDRISLLPRANWGAFQSQLISNATIQIEHDKPIVRWDYDNNLYSISKLTHKILVEFGQLPPQKKYHLNGTKYWGLSGTNQSLFFLTKE